MLALGIGLGACLGFCQLLEGRVLPWGVHPWACKVLENLVG